MPEARFYSSLFGIWLLPIGLFFAAWTSFPSVNFFVPIIGLTMFGSEWRHRNPRRQMKTDDLITHQSDSTRF